MKKKPNIVLIITDQQNIDTISAYRRYFKDKAWGVHHLKTPNLDKLVRGGYSFLLSHTANPVSCCARASLFTGRYSIETGVTYNQVGIDKSLPNIGQWLTDHSDYRCFYCGKWHAGGNWGYPSVEGPHKIPGFQIIPIPEFGLGEFVDYQVSSASKSFLNGDHDEKPFFLVSGLINPHDICFWRHNLRGSFMVPDKNYLLDEKGYPPVPPNKTFDFKEPSQSKGGGTKSIHESDVYWRSYAYDYYRMVEKADLDVGRILNAVENRHDDTIVIFTSDHGEGLGRHSKVGKWNPYDHSVKVPLIFYAPGRIRNKVDTDTLATGLDIFPTICAIAGIDAPELSRGVNLLDLMTEDKPVSRDHIVSEFQFTGRAVRFGRYKFVKKYIFSGVNDEPFVRKSDGKPEQFVPGEGKRYEDCPTRLLFDMEKDVWEQHNLAELPAYKDILDEGERLLRKWEAQIIPGVHYDR